MKIEEDREDEDKLRKRGEPETAEPQRDKHERVGE